MKIRRLSWFVCIVLIFLVFRSLPLETQIQSIQSSSEKEATLKTKAYLLEEKGNKIILVRGETNLPPGTLLQIELKAGSWLLNAVDNIQLADAAKIAVNNDGQYLMRFNNFKTIFDPEYYEISVSVSPEQARDVLTAEGFPENSINQLKDYYLVNIISVKIPARRQRAGTIIIQLMDQLAQGYQEFLNKMGNIEKMKKGDKEIEEKLKTVFGADKTKKELFEALSNNWLNWEKEWVIKINKTIQQTKEENTFPATATDLYNKAYQILDYYHQYRQVAFDAKNVIKESFLAVSILPKLTSASELKKQWVDSLENELVLKISHDIMIRFEQIVLIFQECSENEPKANEIWSSLKATSIDYLKNIKEELLKYIQAGLFLEMSPNKDKKKDVYNQITVLLDLTTVLIDKFSSRLMDQTNKKLEIETRELIDLINLDAKNLLIR